MAMSLFVGIIGILLGVLFSRYPGFFWYIGGGWKFEDAEPSKEVLAVNRWIGYFGIFIGVILVIDFITKL